MESVRSGFGFVGASWELLEPRSVHLGRSSQQVAAYSWQTQDELLLVAANLSERDAEALINLPSDYQEPQNLLSSTDANYQLENGQIKLSLPKSGYAVIKFLKK